MTGKRRPLTAATSAWLCFAIMILLGAAFAPGGAELAGQIKASGRISLAERHVSGMSDAATALHNIEDTAAGKKARRSKYENAPGGEIALDAPMLSGLLDLAGRHHLHISEIAGGSHSANSRHYVGVAFDIDAIDGKPVSKSNPAVQGVMKRCRELGATEVLGPGDPGHDGHVHAAWPRP